jgi:hypothetical protein
MILTSNNDILLSDGNSSDIKLMTKSVKIKPFLSVSPLLPQGIHVTSDNNIIVGVKELGANCVVAFILECPVYVHLKPPSHPTTTTLPVLPDVMSTRTMSLLLFVVIRG